MKYIANPVEVDAFKITGVLNAYRVNGGYPTVSVGDVIETEGASSIEFLCICEDGNRRHATADMCARMAPQEGDYWVIQADGYEYLNPKAVFERKYSPKESQNANSK